MNLYVGIEINVRGTPCLKQLLNSKQSGLIIGNLHTLSVLMDMLSCP